MRLCNHALLSGRQLALGVAALAMAVLLASPAAHAAGRRPLFQMPVPCAQTWKASTYDGHWPDEDSIDLAQRDGASNISDGEPALASAAGTIRRAFTTSNGEHRVYVDHGGGWVTHYIHLEDLPPLTEGQFVAQGEQIGRVSNSGADHPHLHYSQLADGKAVRIHFAGKPIKTRAADEDTWGTWPEGEKLTSLNCPGNAFLQFNQNAMRYHLIYKPASGTVKINRMKADATGVTNVHAATWSKRFTHLVPFTLFGGQQHLLGYKSSTGEVRFSRIAGGGAGTTTLADRSWGKGWTHFLPFDLGGHPYFIAYNSLYGWANIDRVNPEGDGSATVSQGTWTRGWTHLTRFEVGGDQYVLLYKGGTGEVEVDKLTGGGGDVSLTEVWSGTWTKGWTQLVALRHNGSSRLLAYKATSGRTAFIEFKAAGQGVEVVGDATWSKGWTAFSPLLVDGAAHVLAYKAGTGKVTVRALNEAGTGTTGVWTGSWTSGWF